MTSTFPFPSAPPREDPAFVDALTDIAARHPEPNEDVTVTVDVLKVYMERWWAADRDRAESDHALDRAQLRYRITCHEADIARSNLDRAIAIASTQPGALT